MSVLLSEVRRDQWGRYLVVPPGGRKPLGYTRVTTVAKTLDGGGGLMPWKATMAMVGLMRRPGLRAAFEALINDSGGDPWYHSPQSKGRCKKAVEACAEAGGSSDRAEIGTALHAVLERVNRGESPIVSQEVTRHDVDAYRQALDAAGIVIDPTLCEATVVLDEHRVAGTADMLCVDVPGHGRMVGDLKTGADLKYSWQSICVQLAAYANADNVYVQGEATDGSQDERRPMPDISREHGLIIHLPAGEARCELRLVDLVAGWEAFEVSMWCRRWRKRDGLTRLVAAPSGDAAAAPTTPVVEQPAAEAALPVSPAAPSMVELGRQATEQRRLLRQQNDKPRTADEGGDADSAALAALTKRYNTLAEDAKERIDTLVAEAQHADVGFSLRQARTVRRFELARALVALHDVSWSEPHVRTAVVMASGDESLGQPTIPLGAAIGALDAQGAATFAELAYLIASGQLRPDDDSDLLLPVA